MGNISRTILGVTGTLGVFGLSVVVAPSAQALSLVNDEISQYLMIGTGDDQTGDAINVQKTELGADQIVISNPDPNLEDVFDGRWSSSTNSTISPIPPAAPIFEGIDYSGNNAITSSTGGFSYSNTSVYAEDFAVRCASGAGTSQGDCRDNFSSPASSPWITSGGNQGDIGAGNGVVTDYDHSGLIAELEGAWTYINALTAETTITSNLEYGSSSFDIDAADTNNDGIAVIDINVGDNDFLLNDYDWILNGDGSTFGIFRVRGNTNMLMSNSSIALGTGGIGNGSAIDSPDSLGAIFVQYEEPDGNSDSVFGFNNVILNGVGFWDLNAFQGGVYDDSVNTELNVQNGQGCSQFISSSVTHTSSVRWNRCSDVQHQPVPEPLTILGAGAAVAFGTSFKRKLGKAKAKKK